MISDTPILDSISHQNIRLHTQLWRNPKFIHQESLRHRKLYIHDFLFDYDFSFSVSSARAIPFKILLNEVRDDNLRAAPVLWGAEQKGMSPGDELDDEDKFHPENRGYYKAKSLAQTIWKEAACSAANKAERLADIGVHKSICNRIIEPFIHVNCLVTATTPGWMNFFGLRLDRASDPTLRALAEASWKIWNESKPNKLEPGQWHLPFANDEETILNVINSYPPGSKFDEVNDLIKISVARCARLSYLSFETKKCSTIEEDLDLYNRLVSGPIIHASPAEHQATPDKLCDPLDNPPSLTPDWIHLEQSGNFGPGWRQFRKLLPNESIAPLPKEYL